MNVYSQIAVKAQTTEDKYSYIKMNNQNNNQKSIKKGASEWKLLFHFCFLKVHHIFSFPYYIKIFLPILVMWKRYQKLVILVSHVLHHPFVRAEILPLVPPAAEIQTVAGFHPL